MSETVNVSFRIEGGVITSVTYTWESGLTASWSPLIGRRDIEDAVARVANTPVGGREELSKEKP